MVKKILNNKFIQGGFIFTTASFVVSVLNYFFNLILARGFDLSVYGEYMSALSYLAILSVPFSALNIIVINKIGSAKQAERATVARSIEMYLFSNLYKYKLQIITASLLLFMVLFLKANLSTLTIVFVLLSILFNLLSVFYNSVLQAYKSFLLAGMFAISISVFRIIAGVSLLKVFPNLLSLYSILIFLGLLTAVAGNRLIVYKKSFKLKELNIKSISKYLMKDKIVIPTITMIGLVGLLNMDLIMVKKFFDAQEVGLYAALSLLGKIILYTTGPLSLVALTFFSGSENKNNKEKILLLSLGVFLVIGLISIFGYYYFSQTVVNVVFGSKFLEISNIIWIPAIFGTLYSVVALLAQYVITESKRFAMVTLPVLFLQVILFYIFHNSFQEILGVNIGSMILLIVVYSIYITKHVKNKTKIY